MRTAAGLMIAALFAFNGQGAVPGPTVRVYAAGSLSSALSPVATAIARDYGITIAVTAGPSGFLR